LQKWSKVSKRETFRAQKRPCHPEARGLCGPKDLNILVSPVENGFEEELTVGKWTPDLLALILLSSLCLWGEKVL
jgi:hypothetical protein